MTPHQLCAYLGEQTEARFHAQHWIWLLSGDTGSSRRRAERRTTLLRVRLAPLAPLARQPRPMTAWNEVIARTSSTRDPFWVVWRAPCGW